MQDAVAVEGSWQRVEVEVHMAHPDACHAHGESVEICGHSNDAGEKSDVMTVVAASRYDGLAQYPADRRADGEYRLWGYEQSYEDEIRVKPCQVRRCEVVYRRHGTGIDNHHQTRHPPQHALPPFYVVVLVEVVHVDIQVRQYYCQNQWYGYAMYQCSCASLHCMFSVFTVFPFGLIL